MLRNVLKGYLESIKERDFDLPFIALLAAMGYYDIHFTHGNVEFGKDFIAKRKDETGNIMQYSFQTKAGDIGYPDWRSNIRGQLLESATSGLIHPSFDRSLSHQTVFVVTGILVGNTALSFQEMKQQLGNMGVKETILWDEEVLIDLFIDYGLANMQATIAQDYENLGKFFLLYGKALTDEISDKEIEEYSAGWKLHTENVHCELLGFALQAETISRVLVVTERYFEALRMLYGFSRVLFSLPYKNLDLEYADEIYAQLLSKTRSLLLLFTNKFDAEWRKANEDLVTMMTGSDAFVSYLVLCSRYIEMLGMLCLLTETDNHEFIKTSELLNEFVVRENGCGKVPGDYYAVSLLFAVLALLKSKHLETAIDLIKRSTIWLCDRYENGFGLARFEADEAEEIKYLVGYQYEFLDVKKRRNSFLATLLCDITAFLENQELYSVIVNDVKACKLFPAYWQPKDSIGCLYVESDDVITYPNINFDDAITRFDEFIYAEHIRSEVSHYQFDEKFGASSVLLLISLLRDRYLPTRWQIILRG